MKELQAALAAAKIDTATLRPALGEGAETIYCLTSPGGRRAMALWEKLRALVPVTGRWPVLLGGADKLELIRENMENGHGGRRQTAELLRRAEGLANDPDPRAWFYESIGKEVPPDDVTFRPWVAGRARHAITTPYDYRGMPLFAVEVGLLPSEVCWHAPVLLGFGSFNSCPPCEEHAAMQKHWLERYEAEVVAITHDVIELRVGKPPATRDEARRLARQHYSYCTDIVSQGCETVEALAAQLHRGKAWYFWWD
jgi:hypothetical protein